MIDNLSINFTLDGLQYQITIPSDDNIPYNLAVAFEEVINKSNANPEIVLDELMDFFGYIKPEAETPTN